MLCRYRSAQQQEGGDDCGIFAVAFAAVLASGCHPSSFKFKQSDMREHLRQCLVVNWLSDFPTTKKGRERRSAVEKTYQVPVYRGPAQDMVYGNLRYSSSHVGGQQCTVVIGGQRISLRCATTQAGNSTNFACCRCTCTCIKF